MADNEKIRKLANRVHDDANHDAFQQLFDLLWEPMFLYAASIIQETSIAKDLVQEVWMDYWVRHKNIEVDNLKAYLFKAIRYKCYNHLRDAKFNGLQIEIANQIMVQNDMETEDSLHDLTVKINAVLSKLPKKCQEIFQLSRINDFNNKDIAAMLDISQRTVENQISTALRSLRKELAIVRLFIPF